MGIIKNRAEILSYGQIDLRRDALDIIEAGIEGGDPGRGTRARVHRSDDYLVVGDQKYNLNEIAHIYVVGAGKGSFPIGEALEEVLGPLLTGGAIVVKRGEKRRLKGIEIIEAGHPIPDRASVGGGKRILEIASTAGEGDIVFAAITGGASALATVPPEGISLEEIQELNDLLLRSGAVIRDMNIVRRHLCRIKGGRLAASIQPAEALTLTLDTSPEGMPWPDMCLPDPSTFGDAIDMLRHYDLWDLASPSIRSFLIEGMNRPELETIKSFSGIKARMVSVGDPVSMCTAAAACARDLGYGETILATNLEGEAREAGVCMAGITKEIIKHRRPFKPPCALISGGETTVTIRGESGQGGPNQEFVLGFVQNASDTGEFVCVSLDSDGTDGPTEIAGGIIDNLTLEEARRRNVDLAGALKNHRSSEALTRLGGAIITGHTGTNLQNLRVILIR